MKKKIFALFILVLLPFVLSGCVKVDTEVTLDKSGHAHIESKFLVKNDGYVMRESLDNEFLDIEQNAKEKGLEVSKVSENGQIGTKYVFKTNNYNKQDVILPDFIEPTNENKRFLTIKYNPFFTKTNINWAVHFSEYDGHILTNTEQNLIESKLKINIPAKASFSNADSRNDMTNSYEWNLDASKETKIQLEYKVLNWLNIILGIIFVINLIVLLIFVILKSQKRIVLFSSILSVVLLIYFVIFSYLCAIKTEENQKINYYNFAKNEESYSFVDDYAVAKINDNYGLVDKENNFIVKPNNEYIENLNGDYCIVCKKDRNACAYFNKKTKKYLTEFKYTCTKEEDLEHFEGMTSLGFMEGLAKVVIIDHGDIKVGFINAKGVEVIPPKYVYATNFVEGEAFAKTSYNSPEIVIDKTGKEVKKVNGNDVDNNVSSTSTETKQIEKEQNKNVKQTVEKNETKSVSKPKTVKQVKKQATQKNIKQENNDEIDDFMN